MISEIERAKVLKQLEDAAEAIRNNPASDFTEEELRKKIETVSTEEGLEIICMLPVVNYLINNDEGGGDHANANPLNVGVWYVNNKEDSVYFCTNIFYKSCEDNKVTILLEKADDRMIHWHLKGNNTKDSWLDENGKPDYDATFYYASTDSKYEEYGTRVENTITFIVNGKETNEFPTQPGLYEITIDFSKLAEMCTELDYYLISSYEAFYIGEQKTVDYPEDWNKWFK